jgi:hypothetical protein
MTSSGLSAWALAAVKSTTHASEFAPIRLETNGELYIP